MGIEFDVEEYIKQSNYIEGVRDKKQITQSLAAWEYLKDQAILTNEVVLKTHRYIMIDFPRADPGKYRDCWVRVWTHVAPDPAKVPSLMQTWIRDMAGYARLDSKEMHIQYENIHPFRDGNGRTGRMFMWWHELNSGKVPSIVNYEDRLDYYKWFDKEK